MTLTVLKNYIDSSGVSTVSDEQSLADGQTVVIFDLPNIASAGFYICGDSADNGRLCDEDYTVDNEAQITLAQSYPAGTIVQALLNEPVGSDITDDQVVFDTVALMKLAGLGIGQLAETKGYYVAGDGGQASYLIEAFATTPDGYGDHLLTNGNVAVLQSVNGVINVLQYGAVGDGLTDDVLPVQAAINSGNAAHFPNAMGQVYGVGSSLVINIHQGFSLSADNSKRSTGHLLKALAPMEAVIQVLDGDTLPGQNIVTLLSLINISIDGDNKTVFGIACGKHGVIINQLVKFVSTENLSIARCRIGYMIGVAAYTPGTDSANYTNSNTLIEGCTDGGILVSTQNGAAINFTGPTLAGNGFSPSIDTYNSSGEGFNAKVIGGEINFFSGVSTGLGAEQPLTADVIARTGDIRIQGWWSDTHGVFLDESGGVDSSLYLEGIRHNEGGMTIGNTPISIKHTGKLTVTGSLLYGVFESIEGQGGSLTTLGVNFVAGGAAASNPTAYTGTLKTNQKCVVSINNFGNRAQIAIGGGLGDIQHEGFFTPQILHRGVGSSATGPACVRQALGPADGDSGFTEYASETQGRVEWYVNCTKTNSGGDVVPLKLGVDSFIFEFGGSNGLVIKNYTFSDFNSVNPSVFTSVFNMESNGDLDVIGQFTSGPATELEIAGGAITVNGWQHTVDTEASAATDDLTHINGGRPGAMLIIRAESGARDVVIKNTGNIFTAGGADFLMNTSQNTFMCVFDEIQASWFEVSRSSNS